MSTVRPVVRIVSWCPDGVDCMVCGASAPGAFIDSRLMLAICVGCIADIERARDRSVARRMGEPCTHANASPASIANTWKCRDCGAVFQRKATT